MKKIQRLDFLVDYQTSKRSSTHRRRGKKAGGKEDEVKPQRHKTTPKKSQENCQYVHTKEAWKIFLRNVQKKMTICISMHKNNKKETGLTQTSCTTYRKISNCIHTVS